MVHRLHERVYVTQTPPFATFTFLGKSGTLVSIEWKEERVGSRVKRLCGHGYHAAANSVMTSYLHVEPTDWPAVASSTSHRIAGARDGKIVTTMARLTISHPFSIVIPHLLKKFFKTNKQTFVVNDQSRVDVFFL